MMLLTPPRSTPNADREKRSRRAASKLLRSNDAYDTRRLQRLLQKRMARDSAAEEAGKRSPAAARGAKPEYRLVEDRESAYGVRCKFDSAEAARKYGYDDYVFEPDAAAFGTPTSDPGAADEAGDPSAVLTTPRRRTTLDGGARPASAPARRATRATIRPVRPLPQGDDANVAWAASPEKWSAQRPGLSADAAPVFSPVAAAGPRRGTFLERKPSVVSRRPLLLSASDGRLLRRPSTSGDGGSVDSRDPAHGHRRPSSSLARSRSSGAVYGGGASRGGGHDAARRRREKHADESKMGFAEREQARSARIAIETRKRHWLPIVRLAARAALQQSRLARDRNGREARFARGAGASTIGRAWRARVARDMFYWSVHLARAVGQNMRLLLALRIKKKRRAMKRIRWFFKTTERVRAVKFACGKFHGAARSLQRGYRDYRACTVVRLDVLRLLWLRAEEDIAAVAKAKSLEKTQFGRSVGRKQHSSDDKAYAGARKLLTDDDAWDKVSERMDAVREKLVGMSVLRKPRKDRVDPRCVANVAGAVLAPHDPRREAQLVLLLRMLRFEHAARWAGAATRTAHQTAARRYSCREAKRLLALDAGPRGRALALQPTDPGLRKWPLMAFFRPPPAVLVHDPDSPWRRRRRLGERVRDVVSGARVADAFRDAAPGSDFRRASRRASLLTDGYHAEIARKTFADFVAARRAAAPPPPEEKAPAGRKHGTVAEYARAANLANALSPSSRKLLEASDRGGPGAPARTNGAFSQSGVDITRSPLGRSLRNLAPAAAEIGVGPAAAAAAPEQSHSMKRMLARRRAEADDAARASAAWDAAPARSAVDEAAPCAAPRRTRAHGTFAEYKGGANQAARLGPAIRKTSIAVNAPRVSYVEPGKGRTTLLMALATRASAAPAEPPAEAEVRGARGPPGRALGAGALGALGGALVPSLPRPVT